MGAEHAVAAICARLGCLHVVVVVSNLLPVHIGVEAAAGVDLHGCAVEGGSGLLVVYVTTAWRHVRPLDQCSAITHGGCWGALA